MPCSYGAPALSGSLTDDRCPMRFFRRPRQQSYGTHHSRGLRTRPGPHSPQELVLRKCPRCHVALRPLHNGVVSLDHCDFCRGNFLDVGEAGATFGAWAEPASWVAAHCATAKVSPGLFCPAGHGDMTAYDVHWDDEHVEVDVCPSCRGLWLDPHEGGRLQRIVNAHGHQRHQAEHHPSLKEYFFQLFTGMPIEVWNPVRTRPVVVQGLVAMLVAIYVWQVAATLLQGEGAVLPAMLQPAHWMLIPKLTVAGDHLYALLTYAFFHGGLAHLLGNLYFLWIFGDNTEEKLGRFRFLLLFLVAAIAGGLLHLVIDPHSAIPMLGASGAISGIMAAYLWLFPRVRVWVVVFFFRFQVSIWVYLGFWLAMQVGMAALQMPGVAWFAHIGGFLSGLLFVLLFRRRWQPDPEGT